MEDDADQPLTPSEEELRAVLVERATRRKNKRRNIVYIVTCSVVLAAILLGAFLLIPTSKSIVFVDLSEMVMEMQTACQVEKGNSIEMGLSEYRCSCTGFYVHMDSPESCLNSVCKAMPNLCFPGVCRDDITRENNYSCICPDGSVRVEPCPEMKPEPAAVALKNLNEELVVLYGNRSMSVKLVPEFIFTQHFVILGTQWDESKDSIKFTSELDNEYKRKFGIELLGGHAYSDPDGKSSLFVSKTKPFHVEGVLDDNLKLIHEFPTSQNKVFHNVAPIYKELSSVSLQRSSRPIDSAYHAHTGGHLTHNNDLPTTATVKILVVLDSANAGHFGGQVARMISYIATYWNKINNLFALYTEYPKTQLAVIGVILLSADVENRTLIRHPVLNIIQVEPSQNKFYHWFGITNPGTSKILNINELPPYDLVHVHVHGDMFDTKKGRRVSLLIPDERDDCGLSRKRMMVKDKAGSYNGLTNSAVGVAWWLGSSFDSNPYIRGCTPEDGFIMTATRNVKIGKLSRCAIASIESYVRSTYVYVLPPRKNAVSCDFWTEPPRYFPRHNSPGSFVSLNEQCQGMMGESASTFTGRINDGLCENLICTSNGQQMKGKTALDGTPCGYNKVCINGNCLITKLESVGDLCKKARMNYFPLWHEYDMCSGIVCGTYGINERINLMKPVAGTPCDAEKGICIDEVCTDLTHAKLCVNGTCLKAAKSE